MGECTSCQLCSDQLEIKKIETTHFTGIPKKLHQNKKTNSATCKTANTTKQKTKSPPQIQNIKLKKYKRKEERKSTLESIKFDEKKKYNLKKNYEDQLVPKENVEILQDHLVKDQCYQMKNHHYYQFLINYL